MARFNSVLFRALRSCVTRVLFSAAFIVPFFASPATAFPAEPLARIIYTADTLGYTHPCASCGDTAQGGLPRRAAMLRRIAGESPRALILAGPNEFYTDRDNARPERSASLTPALHAAFAAMPYTAVYLSQTTAAHMNGMGLPPLSAGVTINDEPAVRIFRAGRIMAACVFLPPGKGAKGAPTAEQILAARQAAGEAASIAPLVIGVAPWGMFAEQAHMRDLAGYFHILLGAGPGIAIPGQPMNEGNIPGPLWARADRLGRAVTVIDIHSLPEISAPWLEGINFSARLALLEKDLPEDEEVKKLVEDFPEDAE